MKRVLLVTNIPNPYRIPLFNELSRLFRENNILLKVIFGAESYKRRLFKLNENEIRFEYEILKDKGHTFSKDGEKTIFLYKGLSRLMEKEKPDLMMVAGFSTATIKIFRRHILKRTPYIILSGTIEKGNRKINLIRRIQRKVLANHAEAFVTYGNLAKKYLVDNGVPENKIFIGRNTVDTTFFEEKTNEIRRIIISSTEPVHFTYLGYLVPRKNVMAVMRAVNVLSKSENNFIVDVIGDGISLPELKKYCDENNLNRFVKFHGFIQKDEVPVHLAKSRGLLFQTGYDIWGLVLNEAMAAGLTCLASPNAGATYDLITEGETGFVIDFDQPEVVAERMKWLIHHPDEAAQIGKKASEYIRNHVTINHAAKGFLEAVLFVLKQNTSKT